MKSKVLYLFLFFCVVLSSSHPLFAQVSLTNGGGGGFMAVQSYDRSEFTNIYRLQVDINGNNTILSNWSLIVRVNNPIQNNESKTLNPAKVSIRLNNITGEGPTIQEIGATTNPIPLSLGEVPIIQKSKAPIKSGNTNNNTQNGNNPFYRSMKISFDIFIAGGSYLEALKSWQNYRMNLTFILLDDKNIPVSETSRLFEIQIYPSGTPPVDPSLPSLGIQINSTARNGLLEFKTIGDYVNGVSQSYPGGLTITSNTHYALQVRSVSATFDAGNKTLPVQAVSLSIQDPTDPSVGGSIALSENAQTVFNALNTGTQGRVFDLRYFTIPGDMRLLNASPDTYQTTLTYTLIPR